MRGERKEGWAKKGKERIGERIRRKKEEKREIRDENKEKG